MAGIVGIRFKRAGKVYYFDPADLELRLNDYVVVRTTRGTELGQVVIAPTQIVVSELEQPLKPVLRKAEPEDIKQAEEFAEKEEQALIECGKLVAKLNLPMKLLTAEYSLDGNRVTIFFSAEERVDFRELVKELSSVLNVRIELRQVGPRDEAKMIGDIGRCGRQICCATFLNEFEPVSIKMAKEQDLPLNPMKISGACGRLMCCLIYENEQYRALLEKMPRVGQKVSTPTGIGKVAGNNPLKQTVLVELESAATVEFPLRDISPVTGEDRSPEATNEGEVEG